MRTVERQTANRGKGSAAVSVLVTSTAALGQCRKGLLHVAFFNMPPLLRTLGHAVGNHGCIALGSEKGSEWCFPSTPITIWLWHSLNLNKETFSTSVILSDSSPFREIYRTGRALL
jgi:hypothetical protein